MRKTMKNELLKLAAPLLLGTCLAMGSGCSTLVETAFCGPCPYAGTRGDWDALSSEWPLADCLVILDLPLSFALDTATLPIGLLGYFLFGYHYVQFRGFRC